MKVLFKLLLIFAIITAICLPVLAEKKTKKVKVKTLEPQRIEFAGEGHFGMTGDLYIPLNIEKNITVPLVVIIHDLGESRKVWIPYAKDLANKGYSVFVPDLRGHGESILDKNKKKFYWRSFSEKDWKLLNLDVIKGIEELKTNYPQANTKQMVILGSSMGASVAVLTAEKLNTTVKGLFLISPYTNFKNLEIRIPLVNYGRHPIVMVVSKKDRTCYDATRELVKYIQGQKSIVLIDTPGHGVFLIEFEPKVKKIIYDWVLKTLPPSQEILPVPAKKSSKKKSASH